MNHPNEEVLNDYVDDQLPRPDRDGVDGHLQGCEHCRQTVSEIRGLLADAAALGTRSPNRDLLPGIRSQAAPSSRPWLRWGAAAAAVGIVALLAAFRFGGDRNATPAVGTGEPEVALDTLLADFQAAEAEYVRAAEMLSRGLEQRRDELGPETLAILDENLALIDSAIVDVQAVLAREGLGVENTHLLAALYNKKLNILLRASRLSS